MNKFDLLALGSARGYSESPPKCFQDVRFVRLLCPVLLNDRSECRPLGVLIPGLNERFRYLVAEILVRFRWEE